MNTDNYKQIIKKKNNKNGNYQVCHESDGFMKKKRK